MLRQKRRELRATALIQLDKGSDINMPAVALEQAKSLEPRVKEKYSILRKDSTLKLMQDQIIMAKAYANVAKSINESSLYNTLINQCRESRNAIGEANSDAELHPRYCYVGPIV